MNKSTLILVVVLVVLGVVAYFFLKSPSEGRESSYKQAGFSMSVDSGSIAKISIEKAGKLITLENQGGKWMVTSPVNYPANMNNILPILGGMGHFKVGSLVSSNPEKQSTYEVDSMGTKFSVTDRAGKTVSMIVGKSGPSYEDVYFRKDGEKDVYLGSGINPFTLNQNVNEWRDKVISAIPKENITRVEYNNGAKDVVFEKDSTVWKTGGDSVQTITMDSFLNTVMNFMTEDFADTLTKPETEPAQIKVTADSKEFAFALYPQMPDSAKYYVQYSLSPQFFVVSKFTVQSLLKPVEKYWAPQGGAKMGKKKK